jgi:glucosamine 6-phosphate synthetase-like amidotransferase/phosphosugar isomerase protein
MCGIAAVLLYPQKRAEADWQALREHFTENLLFNEERGEAATGLAIVHEDGQVKLYKRSLPARAFVATEEYQRLLASLNERTTLLLGHTRHPTKGNPDNALNNHPLLAGSFCGIHNGHILNDEALFERWQLPRKGEVDSEVIFRLLDQLALKTESSRAAIALTSIVPNLKMLEGIYVSC